MSMEANNTRDRVSALKERVESGSDLQSSISILRDILADEYAELDKAQVT